MRVLVLFLALATSAAGAVAACNADVTEGCATAQCDFGGASSASSTSAASTSGASSGGATSSSSTGGGHPMIPSSPECMAMPPPGPGPDSGDVPCDVFKIIHSICNKCHQGYDPSTNMMPGPLNGAPFPLLNYTDISTCYGGGFSPHRRWQIMLDAINPDPTLATPMPFGGPPLTASQLKTMNAWLEGGAKPVPAGTGCGCKPGWPAVTGGMGCD